MDDNIKKLHQALIDDGYDDVGTEQEFRDYVSDSKNVATLYNALSEAGYDNFKDQKSLETYLSAKAPVAQKPSTPQSSGQSVSSKEKEQSQYPQEVKRGELKKTSLISQALGMMPKVDAGNIGREQKVGGMIANMLLGDNMQVQQPAQKEASPESKEAAPVTTPTGVVNNEGLMDAKLANYIENWKQRPDKQSTYFENMVADLLADGTANSNEEAVNMVMPALRRYANRSAMDVTNQVVSSLPDDTVQDAEQSIGAQWYSHGVQDKLKQEADSMGISYDDYVAKFLKPAMVQSLVNKYGPNYRNIAEGIATRLYSHDEHVQDRLMNQDINDALSSVINKYVSPSVVDEYNKAQEAGSKAFNEGMEGSQFIPANLRLGTALGAQYEANEAKDPAKVLSGLQQKFGKLYRNPKFLNDMSNAAFKVMQRYGLNGTQSSDPKQFKPMINAAIKNELDQLEVKGMMPKGSAEYIMKTGLGNTIVGKIIRKAVQTDYQNWLEDIANQQYQPGFWENVASGALTFAGDAWSYWLPGAAGGKLTKSMVAKAEGKLAGDLMAKGMERKMAERAAKVLIGKSKAEALKSGAVHGAVTFGGQSAISKPIDEVYRTGQFDENGKVYNPSVGKIIADTLGEVAKQSAVGAIMQGGTIANMVGKGRGLATNILADIGGKVADSSIMTGQQMLERMAQDPNFKPTGKDAAESFLESMANLTAIGLPGMVGKYARFKDAREFNKKFDFTDQDIAELKRFGYDGLRDAFEKVSINGYRAEEDSSNSTNRTKLPVPYAEETQVLNLTQKYMDLMNDKSVPEVLKAKMMAVVEGKRPSSFSPVVDSVIVQPMDQDGKVYLETLNKDGGIIDRKEFSSLDEAQKADKKLEYEKTLGLASVLEGEFHNEFTQEHLEDLYNQAAQKYYIGYKLTDEEKAAVYLRQNAGTIDELIHNRQNGIILTDEEQKQLDTYRHFYDSALENSSVLREFVQTFEDSHGVARGTLRKALESKDKKYAPLVESYLKELYNSIELKREMKDTKEQMNQTEETQETTSSTQEGGASAQNAEATAEKPVDASVSSDVPPTEPPTPPVGGETPSNADDTPSVENNVSPSDADTASNESKSDAFVMGQNAYKNGDSDALQAIDYNSDLATGRLQRAFADNEKMPDIVAKAYNEGRDMEQFVAQRASSLTPAQKEAISKYVEAMDAKKGAIDALQHADDGYGEALKEQLWPYQTVDGNIVPATLDSGKQVFLKKANEYGGAFVVVPDEQGQPMIKQVSNAEIKEVGAPVSLDEYIENAVAQQKDARNKQFISQFDGSGLKPNDRVTVAMEEGDANIDMTFAGYSEDGKIVLTDGKDYLPLSKEEFAVWRKNALDNTINEHLDAEDDEREQKAVSQAEADKKQRYANGIVGLSEDQPDYSSKDTDPNVAAEYLQEQFGEDHGKLLNLVNGSRDDIETQLANKKKAAAEYQNWLDTNADLDPEKAKKVEDELSLVNEQIADLDARFKNWNAIRNSVMTPDEVKAMKEERKAEIERAGIDKSSVLPDVDTGVRIPENSELKNKYPTQEAASGYITSERRRVYKMQEETQREIDGVDKILNQYMDGDMELSAEQLRDLNTTKAELANRQNALTADAKALKGKAESLNILYIKERAEQNKKNLEALSPKDRRKELVAKALEKKDMKAIKEIYKDASTDVMDLTPRTLEEFVSERLFPHSLNAESLAQELGSSNFRRGIGSKYDTNKYNYLLANNGEGLTISELAKRVWEDLSSTMESGAGDGLQSTYSDQDIRNTILDMFKTYDSVREMRNVTLLNRIAAAENELSGEEEWYEQQKEREIIEKQKEIDEYKSYIHGKELSLPSESELDHINGLEFDRMMEIEDREREYKQYVKSILPELADYDDRSNEEGYGGGSSLGSDSSRRGVDEGNSQGEEVGNGEASSESEIGEGSDSGRKGRQETGSMEPGEGSTVRGSHLPQEASFGERLKSAIAETETEPTEAQKKAGNYKKGHLSFGGYDYTVETPKGVTRSGKDEQGKPWSVTMHDTYGYILGKIGVDDDHIDMFINDAADLDTFDGNVYVVDQVNPETGEFDEHKVMYGYPSEEAATEAYLANYSKGWKGLGKVTSVSKATFDKWLESSDRKTKPFREYAMIQHEEAKKAKEEGEMLGFPAIDKEEEPINNHIIELVKWAKEQGLEIDPTSKLNSYADLFVMCKDDFGICTLVPDEGEDINQVVYFPDSAQVIDQLGKLQEEFNAGRDLKHSSNIDSELTEGVTFYDADTAREFKDFVNKKLEKQNKFHNKLNSKTIEVPEDATEENPLGSQLDQTNLSFHRNVKEVKPSEMTEAQKVAYDAVSTMLKKAGIPVKVVSNEDMEKVAEAQDKGVVYGYTDGKEIVLNQEHLNPNTPIHEYQHLWRTAVKKMNPELIEHGDKLIMQTQLFADLKQDPNYNHLTDEQICDEAFARLTGEDGAAILEQMAKDAIKENPLDTAKELSVINKLKEWLKKFWYWTLDTFTKWKPEDIKKMTLEDIRNLVLRDLANGVDPRTKMQEGEAKEFHSIIDQMFDDPNFDKSQHNRERYDLGKTPEWMQGIGIKGEDFSLSFKSIKVHKGKDADHDLTKEEWHELPNALIHPFAITRYQGAEDRFRLYVNINHDGKPVAVGVDVKRVNQGKNKPQLEVNSIKTIFAHHGEIGGSEVLVTYDKKITPKQQELLRGLNFHEYPTIQELSAAKIRNNIETAKGNGGKLSVEDKIKAVSQQFGVDEADVAMYANAVKKGSTAEAARARANIKRHLLQVNEDKISSLKELLKYTVPVNNALKENFGDLDAMIEERVKQVEAQRNAMEAARKRAEEEEAKRQKHLEELSVIPDDQLDKQYMDALAKGDDATAREMLDEAARRKGYDDTESAYQGVGAWAAPGNPGYESDKARRDDWESSGSDVNLEDMALGYTPQPDDYFSHPERYSQNTPHGLESVKAINTAIDAIKNGEKDVKVKVYRAVPTSVKEGKLRNGDWVTPSKKYAEMHGTNRLEGKYRIIEDEVPANQLWWDGNDANEFGFDDGKAYKYKNAKNNRKLNDLVTYDDEGDVIPPSKRFNSRKSDVRFMFAGEKANVKPRLGSATIGLKAAKDKVVELFNKAKSGEFNGKPQSIGTLTQEGKKFLEDLSGLKMKDKIDFVLNPSDLKHMNKDHFGDNEKDPGRNIPLTEEDLRSMVDVIMNPEQVVYGIEKMDNRKAFFFLKQAEDGTLNLAEIYSDKKGNLTAKSYYKTKKGVDQRVMEIKNSLLPTPEASSGSPLSDGKGINFFSIEQEKTAENEQKIADSVVNTANKLGGAEATVYFSLDDVPEEYRSEVEQGAKGWYDPETHSVHVYLPNCEDGNDAQRTVFHEKIGHEGMEVLLGGEDGVRKFASFVYRSVGKDVRGKIIDFANKYDPDWKNPDRMNVGTQEYIAHLAEEGPKTAEDFSLWTKIKHYLIKVLKKLGVRVPGLLNDKDLRYYLMKAGKALHVWDNMPKEKQEAMMKQASNAEIKDALSNGPGKGKPQMKKGESTIQYMKRVQEWRKWKNAREDKEDPEPPMFYDIDKDEAGKKEWERLNKEWRKRHELNEDLYAAIHNREDKLVDAVPYIVEVPKRLSEVSEGLNDTDYFKNRKLSVSSKDLESVLPLIDELKSDIDGIKLDADGNIVSQKSIADKIAKKINSLHILETSYTPLTSADILNEHVLPILEKDVFPKGKNLEAISKSRLPVRKEGETNDEYQSRINEYEKWQAAMKDQEDPMPDMFAFEKKKQEEVKRKYEDWLAKHDLLEQQQADLDLYEGKIYPAETNPKADALEQQVMQDLAEVTSTDVSKEGAAKTVKHAVIHRRKNMEEASADDAIYINDVKNRIEKMADSGAFDKLLSDYKGKPNKAEKLAEAIPYIIEAPRRLRDLAHDLNATDAFDKGHIHIQPDDVEAIQPFVADLIAETAKMHTVLKDDKEVKVYDDPQAVSEVANKLAQAINANHQGEEGFVPIDGTDILSKQVLPLVKQQIVPVGIDYKNLSPEMKAAIDSIRDWYNYTYDWLKDNHTLREDTGYNADYVNHIWDKEKSDKQAYAMYVENRQRTKSPNEKPRTISTLMEGISVGLVPKTTDITKMMAYYSRSNIEAWVNKTMLQELSGLNVIERNEDGEIVSSDALLSSTPPFNLEQYKYFEIPGVGPVWVYNVSPKQIKVKNPITGKERVLYSEASAGDRFGVVFETYQSSPFWKAFDTLASSAKKLELGFSGFHAGALTEVYMVQDLVEYGPKKAMANFMKYIFADTMKNHQLPCFANPQDFQEAATHGVKFGATNDYAAADVQNMFDNFRDTLGKIQEKLEKGNVISKAGATVSLPFKIVSQLLSLINKGMDRALWDFLHDGLKLATYRMRADKTKERAKKYGWTDEQLSKALDEDGQFVNDMFGGQHWDILGASHRTLRYAGRVLLSPDWNTSTTRHFLALTGYGSVWNEATFENFKEYYKHLWAAARGKGELTPEDWGRFSRQKSAFLCYGLGFMVFYEGIANGINAAFRALDEEKERKKAEEIRKTNPNYRSMYELAYGDKGMKWYDYLMRGNSLGQQSKIFLGRYEDGTEMYVRHGKQFREVPEYLFNHKGELEFPGPMVQRMIGKANPMVRMTLDDINYLSDFQASHADQEIQRKYGKTIGLLYKDALYWAPFLIPSQENKEFKAVDFFFPSSKGFSPWKAQSYFKDFILSGDMEGVVMTYQSCQRNGIDAEAQIKAAIGSVKALESAEMSDGVTSLQEASKRFDAAKSITEKKKMRQKMKKFLSQSEYKAFTQKEALDMVQGYLNGDEDLKEMEKAESKYLMKAKAEDVTEDWRIQNVWNGTMETYQEYQRLKDVDKAKANAFKNSKTNKRLFAARKAIYAARRKMNKAKKQMDGTNDAAKLVEIRNTRKELLKTLNGME